MSRPVEGAGALLAPPPAAAEPLDARSSGGRSGSRGGHGHKAGSSGSLMVKRFGGSGLRVMNPSVVTAMPVPAVSPAQYAFASERYISFTRGRLFGSAPARAFSYAGYPAEVQVGAPAVAVAGDPSSAKGARYRVCGAPGLRGGGARDRLQRLLASGSVTVESRAVDKYGRTVALVRVGGYDVAP